MANLDFQGHFLLGGNNNSSDGGQSIKTKDLYVTDNGHYEAGYGQAYKNVNVDVYQPNVTSLNVAENGKYSADSGSVWAYVNVNVPTLDVSDTTAAAADVAAGKYFYTAAGVRTEGTNPGAEEVELQSKSKTYTPTTQTQSETVTCDNGYDGLDTVNVTVNPIPSQYIVPSGNLPITQNGMGIDVSEYATVNVIIPNYGGDSVWFGGNNAALVKEDVFECRLSDTDFGTFTPTTSERELQLPATDYSVAGSSATYSRLSEEIDMSRYGVAIILDSMSDMKYTQDEDTIYPAHCLTTSYSTVYLPRRRFSTTDGVVVLGNVDTSIPIMSDYGNLYRWRNGSSISATSSFSGVFARHRTPTISINGSKITGIDIATYVTVSSDTSIMEPGAWNYVDAYNTKIINRARIYCFDLPSIRVGLCERVIYMLNNTSLPTD